MVMLMIRQIRTSAYHPECDGNSERFIQTIKRMITAYVTENKRDWDEQLDLLTLAYNTATHATTKYSPFYLLYGRKAKMPIDLYGEEVFFDLPLTTDDYAAKTEQNLKKAYECVLAEREFIMNKAKTRHDRNVRRKVYKQKDLVWRRKGKDKPLSIKWEGPFRIKNAINESNYRIRMMSDGKEVGNHVVVNVKRLKKCFMRLKNDSEQTNPTENNQDSNTIPRVRQHINMITRLNKQSTSDNSAPTRNIRINKQVMVNVTRRPAFHHYRPNV
jgi:hypothetical protein